MDSTQDLKPAKEASYLDQARAVRTGEELNVAVLLPWLRRAIPSLAELEPQSVPMITQYAGGASNWTYRLVWPSHDLILRRAPMGTKAKGAHDMAREHRIQEALKPAFALVPRMLALCEDELILGSPFYVMERVAGVIPRKNMPRDVSISPTQARLLCERFLDALIALHRVQPQTVGLSDLDKGSGYCQRQIEGWKSRYAAAKTWNVPSFNKVGAWLTRHTPTDRAHCIIHNDYRLDNVVLHPQDPTQILAILDWELATAGDPLMELGSMLAYWVQADDDAMMRSVRRQPSHLAGMMTRQEVVAYYAAKTGLNIENWDFYAVYGYFRLAGIAQQIYYRYHHKQTRNPAFKNYWIFIHYLHYQCRRIMRHSALK